MFIYRQITVFTDIIRKWQASDRSRRSTTVVIRDHITCLWDRFGASAVYSLSSYLMSSIWSEVSSLSYLPSKGNWRKLYSHYLHYCTYPISIPKLYHQVPIIVSSNVCPRLPGIPLIVAVELCRHQYLCQRYVVLQFCRGLSRYAVLFNSQNLEGAMLSNNSTNCHSFSRHVLTDGQWKHEGHRVDVSSDIW